MTVTPLTRGTGNHSGPTVSSGGEYNITFAISGSPPGLYDVRYFGSIGPDPPTNWSTQIIGLNAIMVQTTVNCFDNPPLRP